MIFVACFVSFTNFFKKYYKHILLLLSSSIIYFVCYNLYTVDFLSLNIIDNFIELEIRKRTNFHENSETWKISRGDISDVPAEFKEERWWWWPPEKYLPFYWFIVLLIIYSKITDFLKINTLGWTYTPLGHFIIITYVLWFFSYCFHATGVI